MGDEELSWLRTGVCESAAQFAVIFVSKFGVAELFFWRKVHKDSVLALTNFGIGRSFRKDTKERGSLTCFFNLLARWLSEP